MNALNTHNYSFPLFQNKSREHTQWSFTGVKCTYKRMTPLSWINVQQLFHHWKYYSITTASWYSEHSIETKPPRLVCEYRFQFRCSAAHRTSEDTRKACWFIINKTEITWLQLYFISCTKGEEWRAATTKDKRHRRKWASSQREAEEGFFFFWAVSGKCHDMVLKKFSMRKGWIWNLFLQFEENFLSETFAHFKKHKMIRPAAMFMEAVTVQFHGDAQWPLGFSRENPLTNRKRGRDASLAGHMREKQPE